jgi:AraC family transcriptional regulator
MRDTAETAFGAQHELAPAIHIRDPQVERIGWAMEAESREGYPSGRLFSDGMALALAARLLALQSRTQPREPGDRHALPAWQLRKVVEYIESNLDQSLTLADLASVTGYSVSHFKPLFRRATGMPAHRFVMQRRAARARDHLQQERLSRTEIALATGFAHASHMARYLRRAQ